MSDFYEAGPSKPVTESIRVDKVSPKARRMHNVRAIVVIILALFMLIPIMVMTQTAFKTRSEVVSVPPTIVFKPSLEGFVFLFTERAIITPGRLKALQEAAETGDLNIFDRIALDSGQEITGPSDYVNRLMNSLIIAGLTTISQSFWACLPPTHSADSLWPGKTT